MWKVSKINNSTHSVSMRHADGEVMSFVVPAEHAISSSIKMSYIKLQTDARSAVKKLELESKIEQSKLIEAHKKRSFRYYIIISVLCIVNLYLIVRMS